MCSRFPELLVKVLYMCDKTIQTIKGI